MSMELDNNLLATLPEDVPEPTTEGRGILLKAAVLRAKLKRLALRRFNATEASKIAGCSTSTARMYYADPSFKKEVMEEQAKVFGEIDANYREKEKTLHEQLEDQGLQSFLDLKAMLEDRDLHPSLRVKINQDFLDRSAETAAFAPKSQTVADAKLLAEAARAAEEMNSAMRGKVIEMRKTS